MNNKNIIMISGKYFPVNEPHADDLRFIHIARGLNKYYNVNLVGMTLNRHIKQIKYYGINSYLLSVNNIKYLKKFSYSMKLYFFLKKIIEKKKADILIINTPILSSVLSLIKKRYPKIIVIWDVMGILSKEVKIGDGSILSSIASKIYKQCEKSMYKIADYITTINIAHFRYLKKFYKHKIFIIRDASDPIKYTTKIKNWNSKKIINISFVGSLGRKRLMPLFHVAKYFNKEKIKILIYIIGDGPDKIFYTKYIRYYKLNNIKLLGYKKGPDLINILKKSDILYSDVYLSGFPYKVFEYMSLEKPIIIENNDAVKEIIHHMKNGIIYKNENEMKKYIKLLMRNYNLRKKLGKQAKKDFTKHHTWSIREKELYNMISTISKLQ
jgi:glycosyltransferase involved in cell wall biosynthesis